MIHAMIKATSKVIKEMPWWQKEPEYYLSILILMCIITSSVHIGGRK
jgi:hypothetical protein